jgi:hypothetical protein
VQVPFERDDTTNVDPFIVRIKYGPSNNRLLLFCGGKLGSTFKIKHYLFSAAGFLITTTTAATTATFTPLLAMALVT